MYGSICFLAMHLGVEVLALSRNIMLARLLGPTEMGYATLLAVTLRMLEMASDMATDRLLIQSKLGRWTVVQGAAHGVEILRGLLSGGVIVAVGMFVASSSSGYPPVSAFLCLAMIPVLRGFQHLDFKRLQRNFDYQRAAFVELTPAVISIAMLWLLSSFMFDYKLVIATFLVQALAFLGASHWVAERGYCVSFSPRIIRKFLAFGWPLALNGLLMFLVFQGDRLLVSIVCTPADLARYAIAFQISLIPVLILSRVCNSLFLPLLSRIKSDRSLFDFNVQFGNQAVGVLAIVFCILSISYQGAAIQLLYGPDYSVASGLIFCLAIMHSIRLLRCIPSVAAIATGDSLQPLMVNLVRALGVVGAVASAYMGAGLIEIAACGCVGELLALAAALYGMRFRLGVRGTAMMLPMALGILACLGLFAFNAGLCDQPPMLIQFAVVLSLTGLTAVSLISCLLSWSTIRDLIANAYSSSRRPSQALS